MEGASADQTPILETISLSRTWSQRYGLQLGTLATLLGVLAVVGGAGTWFGKLVLDGRYMQRAVGEKVITEALASVQASGKITEEHALDLARKAHREAGNRVSALEARQRHLEAVWIWQRLAFELIAQKLKVKLPRPPRPGDLMRGDDPAEPDPELYGGAP